MTPELELTPQHEALVEALMAERSAYLAYVRRRVRSEADAEDVVQQSLTRALPALAELRDPDRVHGWFYKILRRAIADHLAGRQRDHDRYERLAALTHAEHDADADAEGSGDPSGMCGCGLKLLEALPDTLEEVVRRVDLHDQSVAEAAEAIGISPGNVRVRAHRAHERLKADLKACCSGEQYSDFAGCQCP